MPEIVQDDNGKILVDASLVFEGVHLALALNDGVPFKKFDDGDPTTYIEIDDAIDWWRKEDAEDGPLEDLLTLQKKIDSGSVRYK